MINGQKEIWISTGNKSNYSSTIIAVSNCGRIMRKNGKIEIASYRQRVHVREIQIRVYHFLANNFITKTEEDIIKRRTFIDHITHTPTNMYINDVRNLRWCTNRENCNFQEAKLNRSKAKTGEKHPMYGKQHSEETKAKMSAAKKGKKRSEEAKAEISAAKKGKKFTDEHRAKLSAAKKGTRWYNNGITSVRANECPIGFVPGQLRKIGHVFT